MGAGALLGVDGEFGIYWTGSGDVGTFGGWQVDTGLVLQLFAGIPLYLFWGGKEAFQGVCYAFILDISAEVLGCGFAVYWNDPSAMRTSPPVGACIEPDTGPSCPVQAYYSYSNTYLGRLSNWWDSVPPATAPGGVPAVAATLP